jgi:hypothetical protein
VHTASAPAACAQDTLVATTPTTCTHAAAISLRALKTTSSTTLHANTPATSTPELPAFHRLLSDPQYACTHHTTSSRCMNLPPPPPNIPHQAHAASVAAACAQNMLAPKTPTPCMHNAGVPVCALERHLANTLHANTPATSTPKPQRVPAFHRLPSSFVRCSLQRDPEGPSQPHVNPGTQSMSRL